MLTPEPLKRFPNPPALTPCWKSRFDWVAEAGNLSLAMNASEIWHIFDVGSRSSNVGADVAIGRADQTSAF